MTNHKIQLTNHKIQLLGLSEKSKLKDINGTYNNKFLKRLVEEYFEAKRLKKTEKLDKKIELEINRIGEKQNLRNQEKLLNDKFDRIIDKLKEQCDFLKPSEIEFILIQTFGFPPKILCAALKIPLSTFYSQRVRIREKIERSSVMDKETFLKFLDMLNQ